MKIELRKEEKINGDIMHSVYIDGVFVSNSCRIDEKEALAVYELIKVNGGESVVTTIKSETI